MKIRTLLLAIGLVSLTRLSHAQIQTAGTLYVNVDATALSPGTTATIPNAGTLGGVFEAKTSAGAASMSRVVSTNGVVGFEVTGTNCMQLLNSAGGSLIAPPLALVGPNPTTSIEVWVLNPGVADDECMVSWGRRGAAGQNMAFEYGYNAAFGAVTHTTSPDLGWDNLGGAPQNNQWHHLVYTYDGGTEYVYVDGVLANAKSGSVNIATNAGIMLGAQWNSDGTTISTTPALATLIFGRVRIHSGTLTPVQVLNNFNVEKATFIAAPPTVQFLSAAPVHRYSFDETPTNDATGLTIQDSIGTAHGIVHGTNAQIVAQFNGRRLVIPGSEITGGNSVRNTGPLALNAYAELPGGLVSVNSTNNGGSGEFSIEVWYRNLGGVASARSFDIGSCGILGSFGAKVDGVGGRASNEQGLDWFNYTTAVGNNLNQRRLQWRNFDPLPSGTETNALAPGVDATFMGTHQTDRHVVVTWKESTGEIIAYENGVRVSSIQVTNAMNYINDVNVWLGRSVHTDNGFAGEFDEVRIYSSVLSPGQVLGNSLVGPDTINTNVQAATILAQPSSATVLEGFPVTFSIKTIGSPANSYQWRRNGTPISGATRDTYSFDATVANNGDVFTCVVSNFTGSANVVISDPATLTVIPNQTSPMKMLHETRDGTRDNFTGIVGGIFQVGDGPAVITHLGYYDLNRDGLMMDHNVGIFLGTGGEPIASVVVPAGTDTYLTNGYRWVALPSPVILDANTSYVIAADVFSGSGDGWADQFIPWEWNFVGTNLPATRQSRFVGAAWPAFPASSSTVGAIYGAPNAASLPIGPAVVGVQRTTVTEYAGLTLTIRAGIGGEGPVSAQWYKSPSTLLPGQTNATLVIPNVTLDDAGDYYVVVSNALGTAQSENVSVTILADTPVIITQQPTSTAVPEGFSVAFTVSASGTPPISYQWRFGGTPINDATNSTYTIMGVTPNDAGLYSVVVSNFANGSPQTQTSASATLTVQPNLALPPQFLHETVNGNRDNFSGVVGGLIQIGPNDALVTHVGYYDWNEDGLNFSHRVGIYAASGGGPLAFATVPAGADGYLTNGYRWVALDAPFLLSNNASYVVAAEVFSGSGDGWPDQFTPANWNPYYIGVQPASTRANRFTGNAWPAFPNSGASAGTIYGAPLIGVLPIGAPVVVVHQTNIIRYEGESVIFTALANGQAPLTVQWYKAPNTLLAGETNLTLTLTGLTVGDSGNFFIRATNPQGTTQSADAALTVYANTAPIVTQQPQPQTVYLHQRAFYSVSAIGQQPLSYQWNFNGSPIIGATNSSFILNDATEAKVGNYSVTVANALGTTNSESALMSVLNPPAGSYAQAVLNFVPLVYYRFSEVNEGTNAFNLGSLGVTHNGTYTGNYSGDAGPQPPLFPNFEDDNLAFNDVSLLAQVVVPDVPMDTSAGAHATFVAWINRADVQADNAGIIFSRANNAASGLGVKQFNGDMLMYHWNNLYFGFVSGLMIPVSQWTFVAGVIEPDRATLYLNDGTGMQTATNFAVHAAVPVLGATFVGWDPATATRRFYGAIDEPMIFDRSLSPAEIHALYNAALVPVVELNITRSGNDIILTWPAGTLQHADEAAGPYFDLNDVTSPYTNTLNGMKQFYRVKVQ